MRERERERERVRERERLLFIATADVLVVERENQIHHKNQTLTTGIYSIPVITTITATIGFFISSFLNGTCVCEFVWLR